MKKVLVVFGTRPEAIKMAPVVLELKKHPKKIITKVCVTAQHRQMLDQVLQIFDIKPDFDLNIMKKNQDLYDITSRVLLEMKKVLQHFKPDLVLVHGDTTTTLATTLAAFYQKIAVGHVEAGLRTYNLFSPWPEEVNRQISDRICTYHFAPTEQNLNNLAKENIPLNNILVTGNTVIDALQLITKKIKNNSKLEKELENTIKDYGYNITKLRAQGSELGALKKSTQRLNDSTTKQLILVTGHRRENFGEGFINICEALKTIALKHPDIDIVYPVHLNPNVRKPVFEILKNIKNIYLIEPLDYLPFVYLMNKACLIITDSGGIQEEAPGLGKPVLVMRDTTERPEGIAAGTVRLVGTNKNMIIKETGKLLSDSNAYEKMAKAHNPYGDGKASQRITKYILKNI
ncbi:MAG: UDP-N-acetylglucosamine 2-epimerase (non-hydrolyzing) [Candidatus Margulisbacteria bacterium]|nr:UDP-N-acetylglucosamine 2-epimerase (non-hydrolyzing) [Candidatus Margulisiibacteriota bacterium]